MGYIEMNQLKEAINKLRAYDAVGGEFKLPPIEALRVICIAQQKQIEMLARVLSKLDPEGYAQEELGRIEGLPPVKRKEGSS